MPRPPMCAQRIDGLLAAVPVPLPERSEATAATRSVAAKEKVPAASAPALHAFSAPLSPAGQYTVPVSMLLSFLD